MSPSLSEFWSLVDKSQIVSAHQCETLANQFQTETQNSPVSAPVLAQWLVSHRILTKYQSRVLLSGKSGPFLFDNYQVREKIESGALKGLYRARHKTTPNPVILHFLGRELAHNINSQSAALQRAASLCKLQSPYLIRAYDLVNTDHYKFVAIESPDAANLEIQLINERHFTEMEACHVIYSVTSALTALHRVGIIHGHIHPQNVWIESSGTSRLWCDPFSLIAPIRWELSEAPETLDRADYTAPELAKPKVQPDTRTDVYAMGCLFFRLLTGHVPFSGGDLPSKLTRHATEIVTSLDALDISAATTDCVTHMMAKRREARFSTAQEVLATLQGIVDHTSTTSTLDSKSQQATKTSTDSINFNTNTSKVVSQPALPTFENGRAVSADAQSTIVRNRKDWRSYWIIGGASIGFLATVVLLAMTLSVNNSDEPIQSTDLANSRPGDNRLTQKRQGQRPVPKTKSAPRQSPTTKSINQLETIPDDGHTLWVAAVSGGPIKLDFVPPDAQLYLVAKPFELMATPEGRRVIEALGPDFENLRESWEQSYGMSLDDVTQMVIAFHANDEKPPRVSTVLRLHQGTTDQLSSSWGEPVKVKNGQLFNVDGQIIFVPDNDNQLLVVGHQGDIQAVVEAGGRPPLVGRAIKDLLAFSNDQWHIAVLLSPEFLDSDGDRLFTGPRKKLLSPIEEFLGDGIRGLLAGVHVGERVYVELRVKCHLDLAIQDRANLFRQRIDNLYEQIRNYFLSIPIAGYWEKLWYEYPRMIEKLSQYTRVGQEEHQVVLNCYLPGYAAHNLVLGGELAIASSAGSSVPEPTTKSPNTFHTIHDVLKHVRLDQRFPQKSLEFAVRDLVQEIHNLHPDLPFKFAIQLVGRELEAEGITRNQQIRNFQVRQKSLQDILTQLVMQANPITTVKSPKEKDQKLVWVVAPHPDPSDNTNIILITTRQAALKNRYKLPKPFQGS